MYAPSLFILNQYFTRRRAIAVGLGSCGAGVGLFSIPLLFEIVLEKYSYYGTMILLGGICLNICVCGALYRPIGSLRKERKENQRSEYHSNEAFVSELYGSEQQSNDLCINETNENEISNCTGSSTTAENGNGRVKKCSTESQTSNKAFMSNFTMLKNGLYCVFLLVFFLNYISYFISPQLLEALMKEKHLDNAALILSILGISEIPMRLLSGILFDLNYVHEVRHYIYACAFAVHGAWVFMAAFGQNNAIFVVAAILGGISRGMIMAQSSVILVDLFGLENLSQTLGFYIGILGLAIIASPFIIGKIRLKHIGIQFALLLQDM